MVQQAQGNQEQLGRQKGEECNDCSHHGGGAQYTICCNAVLPLYVSKFLSLIDGEQECLCFDKLTLSYEQLDGTVFVCTDFALHLHRLHD